MSECVHEQGYTVASEETRERITNSETVQAGLIKMMERYRRYGGNIPTLAPGEFHQQLQQLS